MTSDAVRRARKACLVIVAILGGGLLSGCGSSGVPSVTVNYVAHGGDGIIDQTVDISSTASEVVAPTIRYTALDSRGAPIKGVTVTTAFGSDRGLLAVWKETGLDVLAFHGARRADVESVDAVATGIAILGEGPVVWPNGPTPYLAGKPVSKFDVFDTIKIENEGEQPMAVRVVCLIYDDPPPGETQQAVEVTELVKRIEVAARSSAVATVDSAFVDRAKQRGGSCHSLKAHPTP